jgi:mycothiol synthase
MGPFPNSWTVRAPNLEDADSTLEMSNARSQRFYGTNQSTREAIIGLLTAPRAERDSDMRIALDEEGRAAGLAVVLRSGEPHTSIECPAMTHPLYENDATLLDSPQAWTLRRAGELVSLASPELRVTAEAYIVAEDGARRGSLERAGFNLIRVRNRMRIDLMAPPPEPQWPAGISLRTADPDQDLEAMVALYLETWADHWGFVEQPFDQVLADWRHGVEAEGDRLDPSLWFVATDRSEIVGICLNYNHVADDTTRGYVDALGVRPAWRKRGIALALLHHTFGEFCRRGYASVELDMDSQNLTGALRVYERAGMQLIRQSLSYERELRPGIDLATRELET